MLGPAARHGGLEPGARAGGRRGGARATAARLAPRSVPSAPLGPARRAPLLTCVDVRGPRQGAGAGPAGIGHHGDRSSADVGGRREGRGADPRGLDGTFLPGGGALSSPRRSAAARGGRAPQDAPFLGVPAVGRERALVGGVEECSGPARACRSVSFPSARVFRPPPDLPAKNSPYGCGVS